MAWFRRLGVDSVEYHRDTVLGGSDDFPGQALAYYGSRGQTPMRWGPGAAARLGLAGPVSPEQFDALFGPGARRDPVTGEVLAATSRPGFELVVAAHKSVAVLGAIGRAEDMHAILDAERDATLGYLNAVMAERGGRRGRAEIPTATGGLVWCHTRHATTRAGDPGPHDHVLIANLIEMLDAAGGWRGLHSSYLRDHVHAATMYGRMAGARVAVERGYRIEADSGDSGRLRHWRLAGVPVGVEKLFSKRKTEIDDYLEERGLTSPRARNIAARKTRAAKGEPDMAQLMTRWEAELDAAGWTLQRLRARLAPATPRLGPWLSSPASRRTGPAPPVGIERMRLSEAEIADVVTAVVAPEGSLALASASRGKAISRRDVVVAVAPHVYGVVTSELDRVVDEVIGNAELVPLLRRGTTKDRHWVLASVLAAERAVELTAEALVRIPSDPLPIAAVDEAVAATQSGLDALTADQEATARAIAGSRASLEVIVGVAGAGKSRVLASIRHAYEAAGWRVLGTATAGQAAQILGRGAGAPSRTVASLLWRLDHGELHLDDRTVVILDEAGMTGDLELGGLLDHVHRAGAKSVIVGDPRQLSAVGPGGGLAAVARRHPDRVHALRRNLRQRDPGEVRALAHLRAGDPVVAIDWYTSNKRIHLHPSRDELLDAITHAWAADAAQGRRATMYAWRRYNVAELNRRARQRWRHLGRLTGPELHVDDRAYAAGDRIVILASDPTGNLTASARGHVTTVNATRRWLDVRFDDGHTARLAGSQLANDRLDWGYALTVHRSQGDTIDIAHRLEDGGGRELAYVAASRGRLANHLWLVADSHDEAVEQLLADWTSERSQTWAIDLHTPTPGLPPGEQPAQRISDALHRARLRAERDRLRQLVPAAPPGVEGLSRIGAALWAHAYPELARRMRFLDSEIGRLDHRLLDHHPTVERRALVRIQNQRGLSVSR